MHRCTLYLLILLLVTWPLAKVSAQDQEEEWLEVVHTAFVKLKSLETQRSYIDAELILTFRTRFSEDMPANEIQMIIRFTVDSLQQFQSGSLVIEIGDLDFELSFSESLGDAEKESNSVPLSATILTLQSALVEGHSCFTNVSAEGPLSSELLLELHTTFQDLMSQQDLRKLLINSIIDDPDGWILDLVEHPEERVDEQELRVFSFSLDPDRYISVHQLSKGDLIPPELNQFEDLMDDYIADIKENFIMDWKIWVQVDNGYIYREAMQDSLKGVIDGFDVPELGVWMEIRATGSSDVYHSDHNQLTDADFVLPCVPTGSDATIPVPSMPTPAGAAPDR